EPHVVLEPPPGDEEAAQPGGRRLGGEERVGVGGLIPVRGGEAAVDGQEVLEVGRAAAPDPQHEDGRLDLGAGDRPAEGGLLIARGEGVPEAAQGDDAGPPPVRRINGEVILPQQGQPVAGRDAGEEARTGPEEEPLTPSHGPPTLPREEDGLGWSFGQERLPCSIMAASCWALGTAGKGAPVAPGNRTAGIN